MKSSTLRAHAASSPAPGVVRHARFVRALLRAAPLLAAGLLTPLAHAQSVYSTPCYFDVFFGTPGVPGADFNRPMGVATDPEGDVATSAFNSSNLRVFRISPNFHFSESFPLADHGFAGVAAIGQRAFAIADYQRHGVVIFRYYQSGELWNLENFVGPPILPVSDTPGFVNGTGAAARFFNPIGVAGDKNGIIYVADQGNHAIRKITPAGVVTTLAGAGFFFPGSTNGTGAAARFNRPSGVAVDGDLNVYVGDYGNHTIRKITPAGVVTTLAGLAGTPGNTDANGTAARFRNPWGVAVDGAGVVYVCDSENHTIRRITPAGDVTTLAGLSMTQGLSDGLGSAARFRVPANIALDAAGSLFVTDSVNHTVRRGHFPPRFTAHPAAQVVFLGATANYTATVTSTLPTSYQWRKDGVPIAGATNATLTIANVQAANLGAYTLVATTLAGSTTSNPAALAFAAAPSFTTHPASQTAAIGASVTFTALATGAGAISYQWLKDGSPLPGATTTRW